MGFSALSLPALRGGLLALLAAVLFGVSTPLVQQFGTGLGAFSTAALLSAGAAAVGLLRRRNHREAGLQRSDLPRLLLMAGFGAVIGPAALAWGLQRTRGTRASLMLTLEAFFTVVLAWRLYRETMAGRVWAALGLLLAGAMVLVLDQHEPHTSPHDPVPIGEHSHVHRHQPVQHVHAHVPDAHHVHRH